MMQQEEETEHKMFSYPVSNEWPHQDDETQRKKMNIKCSIAFLPKKKKAEQV